MANMAGLFDARCGTSPADWSALIADRQAA
jgi:hypothetical protein